MRHKKSKSDHLTLRSKEAIKFLKKTRVVKNKKKNLSELPAYLLIGPSNAGKTTLLAKSDLTFLLEKRRESAEIVDSTLDYDWFATTDAVFIDTPGGHFASSRNRRGDRYISFLKSLQKYNYKKRIQGILVTLSLPDLISNDNYVKLFYENVGQQLINMLDFLGKDVPIFLIINKCDFISGFCEFFGELSREERWQTWGVFFDEKEDPDIELSTQFNQGFDKLMYRLNSQLIWRLQYEKNIGKRILINNFPFQMSQLRPYLVDLIENMFDDDRVRLHGVFFTSADQQPEVSYDSKIQNKTISHSHALANVQPFQNRAFFIHDFLNNFIIDKIPPVVHRAHTGLFLRAITYLFSVALVVACAFLLTTNFKHQIATINTAQKAVAIYQLYTKLDHGKTSLNNQLESLDTLQFALRKLNDQKSSKFSFLMGKNRATIERLKQTIFSAYQKALQETLLPLLDNQLMAVLTRDPMDADSLYEGLKCYLMIYDRDKLDVQMIQATLQKIWQTKYPKDVQLRLAKHLPDLFQSSFSRHPIDQQVVDHARMKLMRLKPIERAYIILKDNLPDSQYLSLNLESNEAAASMLTLADSHTSIWDIYTVEQFSVIYPDLIKKASYEAYMGNWVIGQLPVDTLQEQQNIDDLTTRFSSWYMKQYAKVWLDFLDNIKIVHFTQLDKLAEVVAILGSDHSPLAELIALVQSNLTKSVVAQDERLRDFEFFGLAEGGGQASIQGLTQLFHDLSTYLSPMVSAKDSEKVVFDFTTFRMRNKGRDDALSRLFAEVQSYPEPLKSWVYTIGMNVWQLMSYQTGHYINHFWMKNVIPQYLAQIENRFPFSSVASRDVDLESFSYFFASSGVLDQFFRNYLSPFIDSTKEPWTLKHLDGGGLQLTESTLEFFRNVYRIQRIYFPDRSKDPSIDFTIRPIYIGTDLDAVTVALGAQQVNYQHNQPFFKQKFSWPDHTNSNDFKVVFSSRDHSQLLMAKGPWALMKLFDSSDLQLTKKPNQYAAKLEKNGYFMTVGLVTKANQNPFSLKRFSRLKFPREL